MSEEIKLYEVGYLLLPMIADEALATEVAALRELVEKHGGAVETADLPKSRPLAYTIDKKIANKRTEFKHAYFGWIIFRALPEAAPVIKAELDKQDNILRFLLTETVKYEVTPRRIPQAVAEEAVPAPVVEVTKQAKQEVVKPVFTSEDIDKEVEGLIATTV